MLWLTGKLFPQTGVRLRRGQVTGGQGLSIQGERAYRFPQQLLPYGFSSAAASGNQAVLLEGYCAGLASPPDSDLQEGEVRLYSAGGAEILLNRNGQVVINGQVFQPKEE